MTIEIYSDIACPWCYIGKARFERALGDFGDSELVNVRYRPFQLDPRAPADAVPMLSYLEGRFGKDARIMADRVVQTAREEELTIDYETGLAANTLNAHRLLHMAEQAYGPPVQQELVEILFEAHFALGKDVSDVDVLVELAVEAGIDRERARDYLASNDGTSDVRRAIAEAHRLGVTAVPTFVFEQRYAVQGAQPHAAFLRALETVSRELEGEAGGLGLA